MKIKVKVDDTFFEVEVRDLNRVQLLLLLMEKHLRFGRNPKQPIPLD